jgi:glycosyltransferase involved in cell wall biosynthesis
MKISLIIPCYNEEPVLKLFYNEVSKVINTLESCEFELIFVNDGSKDNTLKILKEFAKADSRVRYLSFSRNFGKEAALLAGLDHSTGDYTAVMDADMQDPPSLLPQMIELLESGECDCVATRRVSRKGEPPIRSLFARAFYSMINKMSTANIVDGARDFRMMNRAMTDAILSLREYHRFSKGIFGWVGFETKWLEYENIERAEGETKWSFGKLFLYAIEGIVGFTTIPLRFATIMGVLVSFIAFLYLVFIVVKTWLGHDIVKGYASTMSVILFLGGIVMMALGILGEYLAKSYMESKKRPIYILKEFNVEKDVKRHG